jgi:hypothetical protein
MTIFILWNAFVDIAFVIQGFFSVTSNASAVKGVGTAVGTLIL